MVVGYQFQKVRGFLEWCLKFTSLDWSLVIILTTNPLIVLRLWMKIRIHSGMFIVLIYNTYHFDWLSIPSLSLTHTYTHKKCLRGLLIKDWFHVLLRLPSWISLPAFIIIWYISIWVWAAIYQYISNKSSNFEKDCGLGSPNVTLSIMTAYAFSLETCTTVGCEYRLWHCRLWVALFLLVSSSTWYNSYITHCRLNSFILLLMLVLLFTINTRWFTWRVKCIFPRGLSWNTDCDNISNGLEYDYQCLFGLLFLFVAIEKWNAVDPINIFIKIMYQSHRWESVYQRKMLRSRFIVPIGRMSRSDVSHRS